MDSYQPSADLLDKYAKVLVNFALNSGRGIKPGEVVRLTVSESAKPMYVALRNQVLKSGGLPLTFYQPNDVDRQYYELASLRQLQFFARKYSKGLIEEMDHSITVISETNKHELEGIDPAKILTKAKSYKPAKDWLNAKENAGKFTWTLALYGTPAMAKEAGLTLPDYWGQIIKGCLLDTPDPISAWKQVFRQNARILAKLNTLTIDRLHVEGDGIDLWVKLGPHRRWLGGSGRNIPSYEVFISPDWRGTTGHIEFNQPLYRYGSLIEGIQLDFHAGRVIRSSATKNEAILKQMIRTENADKIGEFSLTDKRLSKIDKFMAETLFDENISGPYGNTHLALGSSYQDSYPGNPARISKSTWAKYGYNDSSVHTDMISTANRTVTAYMANHTSKIIYRDGEFL